MNYEISIYYGKRGFKPILVRDISEIEPQLNSFLSKEMIIEIIDYLTQQVKNNMQFPNALLFLDENLHHLSMDDYFKLYFPDKK